MQPHELEGLRHMILDRLFRQIHALRNFLDGAFFVAAQAENLLRFLRQLFYGIVDGHRQLMQQ